MKEQPQLGIRLKELREKKGFTQKDLADRCKISERTLQRIENGYVKPRMYTLKGILEVLEEDLDGIDSMPPVPDKPKDIRRVKLLVFSILTTALIFVFFYFLTFDNSRGSHDEIKRMITEKNQTFIKLINDGDVDAAMNFYREDACIIAYGCGKTFIQNYYTEIAENFQFTNLSISNISVGDTVAVEKGKWIVRSLTGEELKGEYISEWKLSGNQWLIANEISEISLN